MTDILTGAGGAGTERLQARLRWPKLAREAPGDAVRVALLSTFTIDPLVPYLGTALADAGVTDFVAAEFASGDDQARTRALLKSFAQQPSI